jgi:hypothetical protein
MHRRHAQYLAPLLLPELGAHHSIDPRSYRVAGLVEEHASIVIEAHNGAIGSLCLVLGADDDGVSHIAALDFAGGRGGVHIVTNIALLLDDDDDAIP